MDAVRAQLKSTLSPATIARLAQDPDAPKRTLWQNIKSAVAPQLADSVIDHTRSRVVGGQAVHVRAMWPRELLWSAGGHVFTVVSDAPLDVLDDVVADLPHSSQPPSGWSRVERGAARVFSWLNPFH